MSCAALGWFGNSDERDHAWSLMLTNLRVGRPWQTVGTKIWQLSFTQTCIDMPDQRGWDESLKKPYFLSFVFLKVFWPGQEPSCSETVPDYIPLASHIWHLLRHLLSSIVCFGLMLVCFWGINSIRSWTILIFWVTFLAMVSKRHSYDQVNLENLLSKSSWSATVDSWRKW
jgi:hypothetical protein